MTRHSDCRSYKLEGCPITVIEVAGQIDSKENFESAGEMATESETEHVAVLMEGITYINSKGCGGLIALHHKVEDRGFHMFVVKPVGGVARVIKQVGCDRIVRIRESLKEVIREVAGYGHDSTKHSGE